MDALKKGTQRISKILSHFQKKNVSSIQSNGRRLVRFCEQNSDQEFFGILNENDEAILGTKVQVLNGNIFEPETYIKTGETKIIGKLLTPIKVPNIFCIGLNYRLHAKESGIPIPKNPVIFMKPTTAIINPNESILLPNFDSNSVDYEVEMVIVIGKACKNVSKNDALKYVLGYTIANDVSARNSQLNKDISGGQWIRGKSFDSFCPLGPCLLLKENGVDGNNLRVYCKVNGVTLQDSNTNDLIFNVQETVSYVSQGTTLLPGTIILTGTPFGVGFARKPPIFLKNRDNVMVGIDGIGQLVNDVKHE